MKYTVSLINVVTSLLVCFTTYNVYSATAQLDLSIPEIKLFIPGSVDDPPIPFNGDDKDCLYSTALKRVFITGPEKDVALELYVQSLDRKMVSAFKVTGPSKKIRRALNDRVIEIVVRSDGGLCGYRVLNGKYKGKVVGFIETVLHNYFPFSAFPESTRKNVDVLHIKRIWMGRSKR